PYISPDRAGHRLRQGPVVAGIVHELVASTRLPLRFKTHVIVPALTRSDLTPVILINRGLNRLTFFDAGEVRRFAVATGQSIYPTPTGRFQIVVKWVNPWWYPPTYDSWAKGLKPVPPGPGNPLGTRWMGLSAPGVGIHGTPDAASIGYSASHGCIRMRIPQAEWLFRHVSIGTTVFIVSA
ncbi:MAG: L,D-transpeptidase, partial [Actinomycetota bacterium]|nr:L,D-transpeptidase [Actinomycetota bacterium]